MIRNYVIITWRHLMKNKFYIFINVLGMAIAIASCIVAFHNYDFNRKFDGHHTNASRVYRVNSVRAFQDELTTFGHSPLPMAEALRQNAKDIVALTRFTPSGLNFRIRDEVVNTELDYIDPDFFTLFSYEFVAGSSNAIREKNKIVISEELARKFFGDEPALGKMIVNPRDTTSREFEVGGVFRVQPRNSSFDHEAFLNYQNIIDDEPESLKGQNWKWRTTLFIKVDDPSRLAAVEAQINPYRDNNNLVREDFVIREFKLDPLAGMAVRDMLAETPGTWTREAVPIAAVVVTAIMGGFVLLIACFNLTNSAIAVSSRRLKEIGIRKVVGGVRSGLVAQFIGETMFICLLALALGIVVAEFFLIPQFNAMWPFLKITTNYFGNPGFLVFLVLVLVFTSLVSGGYPSLYISRFNPVSILKGTQKFGGTNYFTMGLLMLQFGISLLAVIVSISFVQNAAYQRDLDLGFKKNVVYTWIDNQQDFQTYRNELAGNPEIEAIAGSAHHILINFFNDPIRHEEKEIEVDIMDIGEDYLPTIGAQLTSGRYFTKDSETDHKESVIITENLASQFGWNDPIGKEITWLDTSRYYVVGVVKSIYNRGFWRDQEPIMFRYAAEKNYRHLLVSGDATRIVEINKTMEAAWKKVFPNKPYTGAYMDEEMAEAADVNNNIVKMFVFLGVVAMMLSATGLFTLVSLNIIRRMKEIGVRKVLGASVSNIARVTNRKFAYILLVAAVFGTALGGWLTDMFMASIFKFYQSANVITFVLSVMAMFLISLVTIGYKVYSASKLSPVNTLRTE